MTDDNIRRFPGSEPDAPEMETADERARRDERSRSGSDRDEQEPNPLLRDGADAPDAADIEDPSEQL